MNATSGPSWGTRWHSLAAFVFALAAVPLWVHADQCDRPPDTQNPWQSEMNNPCFRNPVDPNGERIDEQVSCENPAGCGTQTTSQRTCTQGNRSEQRFLVKSEGFGTGQTSRVTYNLREENLTVIRSQNSQDRFLVRDRDKGVPTRVDGVAGCGVVFPDNIAACAAPFTVVTVFETRNGTVVKNEGPEPKCSG